jgi:ABC-2 type transport system ATP-binding protein
MLLALAYRPELLVLDEPSSGLDPLVRREMLEAIIRAVAEEGRTVLFSSHLLDEVERVSDHLAMLHQGRLVFTGPLDQVRQSHRRLVIQFADGRSAAPNLPGALSEKGCGREWTIVCGLQAADTVARAAELGGVVIEEQTATIEEIFLARAGQEP